MADQHDYRACYHRDPGCPRFPCRVYREGFEDGERRGYDRGFSDGEAKGYADGYARGRGDGYADGYQAGVAACPRSHSG